MASADRIYIYRDYGGMEGMGGRAPGQGRIYKEGEADTHNRVHASRRGESSKEGGFAGGVLGSLIAYAV